MRNSMAIRRIASAALAASLALTVTVSGVGVKTAAASENINATADIEVAGNVFNNGNFETGDKTSWINEQGDGAVFTVTDEEHFEGKYSLKLEKPSDVSAIIKNYCYYIEAGAVYTVSFAYKITEGTLQTVPVVGQYTSDWKQTSYGTAKWLGSYAHQGVTDGWKQVTFDVTAAPEAEILEFCLAANMGDGVCYFDDVRVVKKSADGENVFKNGDFSGGSASGWTIGKSVTTPAETEKVELLSNGDFSNGFTGWSRTSNTEIIEEDGKNVLKMTVPGNGNDSITSADIPVEIGKTYTVSMRLKIDQVGDGNDAQCQLYIIDSKWTKVLGSVYKTYGNWKEYTAQYTATTNSVKICAQHNGVAGTSYWSDISLSYEKVETYTVEYDITKNGGFEEDGRAWNFGKSNVTVVSGSDVAHTGNKALKYDSTGSAQNYFNNYGTAVEAGKTYTMSFYVKTEDTIKVNPYVTIDNKNGIWNWEAVSEADDWTFVTNTFTAAATGTLQAGFQFQSGSGVAYIDDMTVTYTEEKECQPTVSEGVGSGFGYNGDYGIMANTNTNFWNYSTTLEEGKYYTYSMYVKTEDTQSDFEFRPYLQGAKWVNFSAVRGNKDWTYLSYTFEAPAARNDNAYVFGFTRNGTGTVYISHLSVIADSDDAAPDDMLPNGNFADGSTGWQLGGLSSYGSDTLTINRGYTGKGALITHAAASKALVYGLTAEEPVNVVTGKTYTLKANVKTAGDVTVGASMLAGDNVLSSYGGYTMSGIGEWKTVTYHLTVPEDADVSNGVQLRLDMAFNDNAATVVYDDVVFYREYAYGDINGDDEINILDLIRIKKYFSDPDGTEIIKRFSDITGDKKITAKDMAKLRKMLLEQ